MVLATLDPARSRRLAVALLILAIVAVVAAIGVPVWLLHRYYDRAIAENADKLDRYRRVASTRAQITKQHEALRSKDMRRFFLRSGAPAFSAAEAQDAVKGLIESSGGRIITMQAPSTKEEGRYRQVTANVQMTANILALRRLLHSVETNTPYLFIDNIVVRSQVPGNFKPAPGQEPEMFVQFDVTGYALTGS
jgi:general secretion pathway protein M